MGCVRSLLESLGCVVQLDEVLWITREEAGSILGCKQRRPVHAGKFLGPPGRSFRVYWIGPRQGFREPPRRARRRGRRSAGNPTWEV